MPLFERDVDRYCTELAEGETTLMYIGMTFGSRLSIKVSTFLMRQIGNRSVVESSSEIYAKGRIGFLTFQITAML